MSAERVSSASSDEQTIRAARHAEIMCEWQADREGGRERSAAVRLAWALTLAEADSRRLAAALTAAERALEAMTHQCDYWEQRYETQHRTLHRMEDTIAELRAGAAGPLHEAEQA